MRKIIFSISFLLSTTLAFAQQNTILIIADDVSSDYFGCFSTTSDTATTPNIRALANRGVSFTKVWSAPTCSPARAGILAGRYPFRTGVGYVITSAASPQIDTAEISISKLLKYSAPITYNTACVGKWHLTVGQPAKYLYPNKMGFDYYSGNFNGAIPDYSNYTKITNGVSSTVTTYATTQTLNDAISWMDTMNTSKPFFLWLAFNAPHSPFHLPPATLCNTTGLSGTTADISANPKKYFKAAIEAMDTEIGRLFQYLKARNLLNNTNIIFIGDNGNETQVAQIANPNKAKATIYDYGIRVPMIVAGPAVVSPNRICNELISTADLFATVAELCGFYNWKNSIPSATIIDSKSFLPILKNQIGTIRTWIFSEQFNNPTTAANGKTIRNKDYHLLRFDNGTEEFYNQTLDAEENTNLLTQTLTATDISNYDFLCDSITALTGTGTACLTLAVENVSTENQVQIYPNPTGDFIHISSVKNIMKCEIADYTVRLISSSNSNELNVSTLSKGVYFVKIYFNNASFTIHKFIKNK